MTSETRLSQISLQLISPWKSLRQSALDKSTLSEIIVLMTCTRYLRLKNTSELPNLQTERSEFTLSSRVQSGSILWILSAMLTQPLKISLLRYCIIMDIVRKMPCVLSSHSVKKVSGLCQQKQGYLWWCYINTDHQMSRIKWKIFQVFVLVLVYGRILLFQSIKTIYKVPRILSLMHTTTTWRSTHIHSEMKTSIWPGITVRILTMNIKPSWIPRLMAISLISQEALRGSWIWHILNLLLSLVLVEFLVPTALADYIRLSCQLLLFVMCHVLCIDYTSLSVQSSGL